MDNRKDDDQKPKPNLRLIKPESSKPEPEFKPGDTPYLEYGDTVLNSNVNWDKVLLDIALLSDEPMDVVAQELGLTREEIWYLSRQNYAKLPFKLGARLLRMQEVWEAHYLMK